MAITINGSGTVTGLSVGGLPDGTVDSGTLATDSVTAVKILDTVESSLKSGRKNLIINGGMDVWQRGTTFTGVSNSTYAADRWVCLDGVGDVVTNWTKKTTSDPFTYIERTSGSNTGWGLHQFVEMTEAYYPAGTTFTVSADIKHVSGDDSYVFTLHYRPSSTWGSATWNISSSSQAAGTTGTRLSATFTLPTDVVSGDVCVKILPTSTNNGQKFGARNVQLELGSVATDFEHRIYGEELALCQRYYQSLGAYEVGATRGATGTYVGTENLLFPVKLRTTPTLNYNTVYSSNGSCIGVSASDVGFKMVGNCGGSQYLIVNYITVDAEL